MSIDSAPRTISQACAWFAQRRNYGLTIIRSGFFLNAGCAFIIYTFAGLQPAMYINLLGVLACILAGFIGWQHWIHEGNPRHTAASTAHFASISIVFVALAYAMWVFAIVNMLMYYGII